MCSSATCRFRLTVLRVLLAALAVSPIMGQVPVGNTLESRPDWRPIGNRVIEVSLASPATGPVERAWFSADGSRLYARTPAGRVFQTSDFENWQPAAAYGPPPSPGRVPVDSLPEVGSRVERSSDGGVAYALGRAAWRSQDQGKTWENLTDYRGQSILGEGLTDLSVSPRDPSEIVVSARTGVWRSLDGGLSWSGLNESLPNLPVRRFLRLPGRGLGTRILLDSTDAMEWAPGEKSGWRPVEDEDQAREQRLKRAVSTAVGAAALAVADSGDHVYAGSNDGRLWASTDQGRSWRPFQVPDAGPVESLFVDPAEPSMALAALGQAPGDSRPPRLLRTVNAGIFWDDWSGQLPGTAAYGVAADRATGAIYTATDVGVFLTYTDLRGGIPPAAWTPITAGLPSAPARDVRLDEAGHQLYIALEGYGVFASLAPHRMRDPRVVNAADAGVRAAAPGTLLSVLGSRVRSARAGTLDVPVLAATPAESQLQIPFEATGDSVFLAMTSPPRDFTVGIPLQPAAPAIFTDRDGTAMVLDASSGVLLDAMTPARSGSRIQILATGLGRVRPEWPTGLPAPIENPPSVVATVRVYLDREPVEVRRSTLAPGYVGFYLVEVRLPEIVNLGTAELYIEAAGAASNRVRIFIEP